METILLVEDESDLAQIILRELEHTGYMAVHATDGIAALEMHAHHSIDLVVLDWMLPHLSGLDVLRRLRQSSSTPVLMLTARGEETDRVIGLEVGADDYLTKPFSMRELIARIRALLRRAELVRQTVNAATLDNVPLDLSPTEFALLQLLLRSPGRAFSRSYLIETLWSGTYIGGDRSVDNAVLRLRKKLGKLGEAIETVWGIGYRLRSEV
jgi:DNA-binding response OmpR family regulator